VRRLVLLALSVAFQVPAAAAQEPTEVVILGVSHSGMLVAESYRPAVFRAFFERVDPDAICVERSPEEFARGDHYEFTYEIQHIAVPFARERGIPICPFDWMPDPEDQELAFGVDLSDLPFLRGPESYADFLTVPDTSALRRELFYAESEEEAERNRSWYLEMAETPRFDFARRLFLYRTFLQAMRIARAAREHPAGRVLVLVGSMHKPDLEAILAGERGVRVVPPPELGAPTSEEIARHERIEDLAAIATFNLLGAQSRTGVLDLDWLRAVIARLERERPRAETSLLATRLDVLEGRLPPSDAAAQYEEIASAVGPELRFTWDGVLDRRRLDSFADPFGNLTVGQRGRLERARELMKAGERERAAAELERLASELSPMKAAQLRAYAPEWIRP
jgi:hypothetical protein